MITMVDEAGRALVLAFNKWDLVDEDRRDASCERELERDLVRVPWAERVNVSALTGRAVREDRAGAADRAGVLGPADPDRAAQRLARPSRSRRPRRRCAAASSPRCCSPPRRRPGRRRSCCSPAASWRPGYRRFLERRLREEFGFTGSPVRISVRVREKRARKD